MAIGGLCENCVKGGLLNGEPAGKMEAGAYLARAPSTAAEGGNKTCLVLLTDAYGLPLVNSKLIADDMAKTTGWDVWVPDMFNGKPPVKVSQLHGNMPSKPRQSVGFLNAVKLVLTLLSRLPYMIMNRSSVLDKRNHTFFVGLRKDKGYTKIGAFGYCMGGGATARIATTTDVDSAVVCHPGPTSKTTIQKIRVPTAFVCAEEDFTFSPAFAKECEAILKSRQASGGPQYEFKEYKGVVHGFAARPNLADEEHKAAFQGAFEQTATWFQKTLA